MQLLSMLQMMKAIRFMKYIVIEQYENEMKSSRKNSHD